MGRMTECFRNSVVVRHTGRLLQQQARRRPSVSLAAPTLSAHGPTWVQPTAEVSGEAQLVQPGMVRRCWMSPMRCTRSAAMAGVKLSADMADQAPFELSLSWAQLEGREEQLKAAGGVLVPPVVPPPAVPPPVVLLLPVCKGLSGRDKGCREGTNTHDTDGNLPIAETQENGLASVVPMQHKCPL